ncbi:50S ribosomal protein L3 [Candidatus Woesearchaeota archaeon]|nr:MAG: 50S ribosomal protein L3 [Candidatus Woesearchaeota archaeon]
MPKKHQPRFGSMQVWPRKRAKRATARVRSWPVEKFASDARPLGFPVYKAGMTHVMVTEQKKTSHLKGETLQVPVTVLECPPLKIFGVRGYVREGYGLRVAKEVLFRTDKLLDRRVEVKKGASVKDVEALDPASFAFFTILVHTQPKLTGFGKKTPDVAELRLGGGPAEQLAYIKEHLTTPLSVGEVFKEGDVVDAHAVTKGKGFQGPVKRFGIGLKHHKSEKGRRVPGSLGPWSGQGHIMYRVAQAGQTGFHTRTQFNNIIYKIADNPADVNPKGGFVGYGFVQGPYLLVRGSVQGPKKRLITLTHAQRTMQKKPEHVVVAVSVESQQGV